MLTAYVAIAYRGDVEGNLAYARHIRPKLREWFPQVDWYFPTLDEEMQSYLAGFIDDAIWPLCFPKVRERDMLIAVRNITEGVALEMVVAEYAGKPVLHLDCIDDDEAKDELAYFLMDMIGE